MEHQKQLQIFFQLISDSKYSDIERASPSNKSDPETETETELKLKNTRRQTVKEESAAKNVLKCRHCQLSFAKKKELRTHLKQKHNFKTAKNRRSLKSLKSASHRRQLASKNSSALVDLMASNFNSEISMKNGFNLKCSHCQFVGKNVRSLELHFRMKHSSDEENVPEFKVDQKSSSICDFCPFVSDCKKSLKSHVRRSHSDKFKYSCENCNFSSNFHAGITYHMKSKHPEVTIAEIVFKSEVVDEISNTNYDCIYCQYESASKSDLEIHVEKEHHRRDQGFHCSNCEFSAKSLSGLKHHKKTKHSNSSENSFVHDEAVDPELTVESQTKLGLACPVNLNQQEANFNFYCKICKFTAKTITGTNLIDLLKKLFDQGVRVAHSKLVHCN